MLQVSAVSVCTFCISKAIKLGTWCWIVLVTIRAMHLSLLGFLALLLSLLDLLVQDYSVYYYLVLDRASHHSSHAFVAPTVAEQEGVQSVENLAYHSALVVGQQL